MHQRLLAATALCSSLFAQAAFAAEDQPKQDDAPIVVIGAYDPFQLDSENSTGSRLDLKIFETPASVDIITGETIRLRGDLTVQDAVSRAAGVSMMGGVNNGGAVLTSRGFSGQNSVVQMTNGIRIDTVGLGSNSFPYDSWMADRIEVLRGPASVLYGAGAIGGVVNVVTKAPSREWQHEFRLSYGSYNTRSIAVGSGGPLGNVLSYRIDAHHRASDNWVDRGESQSWAISAAIRADLASNLRMTLSHDNARQDPMAYWGTPLIDGELDLSLRKRNFNIADAQVQFDDNLTRLDTVWDVSPDITISNQSYLTEYKRYWHAIETYTWQPATQTIRRTNFTENRHYREQFGTRTDAVIRHDLGGLENNLTFGAEWARNRYRTSSHAASGAAVNIDPYNYVPDYYTSINYGAVSGQHSRMEKFALSFEDRIAFSPTLSLIGGLRYEKMDLDYLHLASGRRETNSFDNVSWRIGGVYEFAQDIVAYAQYATGADPIADLFDTPGSRLTTRDQVEIGLKQKFLGGRAEWTLAAYRIVKKNLMTPDPDLPSNFIQVGQQSSKGIEASLALALTGTLRLDANAALLEAKYDDFDQVVGGALVSRAGNVPTNVPEQMANLWAVWDVTPQFSLAAGARHVGKRYASLDNIAVADAFTVVDANISYRIRPELRVFLRVYNAFDTVYVGGNSAFNSGNQLMLSRPRSVELELSGRF